MQSCIQSLEIQVEQYDSVCASIRNYARMRVRNSQSYADYWMHIIACDDVTAGRENALDIVGANAYT